MSPRPDTLARGLLYALCLLGGSGNALAIVNVEQLRIGTPQPGLSGWLDLSLDGSHGNTRKSETGLDARLQWQRGQTTDLLIAAYDYGESDGLRNTNRRFLHARHTQGFAPARAWEAFAQAQTDEFARLSFRGLLGAGLRLTLSEKAEQSAAYLGIGAFFARERLAAESGTTDAGDSTFWQANLYLTLQRRLNDQLSLASTTYYQPRLDDGADFRALEQASLRVKMTARLSFRLSLDVAYDSRPPQRVERTDTRYSTGLRLTF